MLTCAHNAHLLPQCPPVLTMHTFAHNAQLCPQCPPVTTIYTCAHNAQLRLQPQSPYVPTLPTCAHNAHLCPQFPPATVITMPTCDHNVNPCSQCPTVTTMPTCGWTDWTLQQTCMTIFEIWTNHLTYIHGTNTVYNRNPTTNSQSADIFIKCGPSPKKVASFR